MTQFIPTAESFEHGALTLPGSFYTSADHFAHELERIFCGRWMCVGRESQVRAPGDWFVAEIGDESIIVARGSGGVRAFHNVCRHRGTRICTGARGHGPGFVCPYHGWAYNLDGELIAAPLMKEVATFRPAEHPLHPVAIHAWEGFLFMNLSPQPEPFAQAFAQVADHFARWHLPELEVAHRIDYDVAANWKIVVENFSECYHCPLIHPEFASKAPYRSGQNDLPEGPFLGGFMELSPGVASLTRSGRRCGPVLGELSGADLERVYFYALFPNLTLGLHPDYVFSFTVWPLACDHTRVSVDWLFPADALRDGRCDHEDAVRFWDNANREDWGVCELLQAGMRSRAYRPSPYSSTESLLVEFNREVVRALNGAGHGS